MDTKSQPLSFCQKLFNLIICKITPPPPTTTTTPDSDIIIEFNHSNTSQNSSQINQPYTVQKGSNEKDQEQQDKGKRPKKSVTIKEPVEELSEMKKRRDEDEAKNNNKSNDQTHVIHTKPRPPRHWGPLLSVESNINEKSDAFIRSRKKAMGDPDKKS